MPFQMRFISKLRNGSPANVTIVGDRSVGLEFSVSVTIIVEQDQKYHTFLGVSDKQGVSYLRLAAQCVLINPLNCLLGFGTVCTIDRPIDGQVTYQRIPSPDAPNC